MKILFTSILFVCICAQLTAHGRIKKKLPTPMGIFIPPKNSKPPGKQLMASIPVPQLGTAANFVLFTVTGAVGNTGVSNINGNVGANIGAVTGFAGLNCTTYNNDGVTAQCVTDLIAAYNQINAITPTAVHGPILGNGETLYTGVYSMSGAGSAAGVLTLDAQGDPNAEFIFNIGAAFATGAGTTVVLINGASASNVYWVAQGAISMAASTTMMGTLIANNAAISMGAGGTLEGRMFSTTGAVSVYGDFISKPVSGFTWIGAISTNWNTGANWRGGLVPTSTDDSFIGTDISFNYFPNIPALSGSVGVGSIAFGTMGGQASGVVVNTGSTLNVTRAITYQSDAGSGSGYTCTLSGTGTINTNDIVVIASTALSSSYDEILASSVANLNVLANIALSSSNNGAVLLNAKFNLTGGTTLVSGLLQTTNTSVSTSSFIINPATTATLQFVNATALSGLSGTGINIVTFNNTGAIVEYSGASQTVYTDSTITGLAAGVSYQSIKFSGTGIKTASTGNLNIAGDYTTILANDAGDYVNLTTPTVNFNGTTQNLAGGAGNGTMLYTVTFTGAGTKTMTSGNFYVASLGVLTMAGSSSSLATGGFLTLNSDASGSATVAAIPTGSNITGNVSVQRYLTGGTITYRGYRLLSSPVYASTVGSNNVYSIDYLKNSIFLTGTSTSGGFDNPGAANPTLYLYRENVAPLYSTFLNGNFKGINDITSSPTYSMDDASYPSINIPAGDGFLCFFRGNRASASFAAETVTTYVPQTATLSAIGILNQGQITVKNWFTPSLSTLSYTTASPSTVRGYNLVGNPYASSIDWETFQSTTSTVGIYGTSIGATIYIFDPISHNYGAYTEGNSGIGTNNASNIIPSGQGFFVVTNCSCGMLIFNEGAKVNTQVTGPQLLMGKPKDYVNTQCLRLQLAKDPVNTEDVLIRFNHNATIRYDENLDAQYIMGYGQVNLSSISNDNVKLAIKVLPLPKNSETVRLMVRVNSDGVYKLNMAKIIGVSQLFDIWLMDAYKKDSLDMRHNATYSFNVIKSDSNTYGSKRFTLVIRQNPAYAYRLLNFTAAKVFAVTVGAREVQAVWKTENEQNYTNFTVERSTDGGQTFNVIGGLQGNGQTGYTLADKSPVIGRNSYRLKQEDINNTITYSNVVQVSYSDLSNNLVANNISVYPNPASSVINIALTNDGAAKHSYTYRITNSLGLVVKQITSEQANWKPNISDLMPGSYIIKVLNATDNSVIGNSKFIKL